jgi:hypothetical protein
MNRRLFFGQLASGLAALRVKLPLTAAAPPVERLNTSLTSVSTRHAKISMEEYTGDAFASRVGQVFAFHRTADANDPPIHLELVDVQSSRHQTMAGGRQPFSLLFVLRDGDATQESTLHLRHDEFERCAWFVNRVTAPERDRKTPYYEAVFG